MTRLPFFEILVAAMAFALPLHAQPPFIARLIDDPFNEFVRSEAPVSGEDILGLTASNTGIEPGNWKMFVQRPSTEESKICVDMTSADGLYTASNTYDLGNATARTFVELPIPTRYPNRLKSATLENFAVQARIGPCPSQHGALLITAIGHPPQGQPSQIGISVLGARNRTFITVNNGPRIACTPLRSAHQTAFDAYCQITLSDNSSDRVLLQIERCAFDECDRTPTVTLIR